MTRVEKPCIRCGNDAHADTKFQGLEGYTQNLLCEDCRQDLPEPGTEEAKAAGCTCKGQVEGEINSFVCDVDCVLHGLDALMSSPLDDINVAFGFLVLTLTTNKDKAEALRGLDLLIKDFKEAIDLHYVTGVKH